MMIVFNCFCKPFLHTGSSAAINKDHFMRFFCMFS